MSIELAAAFADFAAGGALAGSDQLVGLSGATPKSWLLSQVSTFVLASLDPTLTALAAYNTNGILTQTAADTFVGRTLTAGSAKISVTNGSGVSGNPTVDLGTVNAADIADGTTVGRNLFKLTNPGAISFLQLNADNSVTAQTASAQRTALGLAIGTNVQAYSANLATFAGIAPSANVQTLLGAASFSAFRSSLGVAIGTDVQAYNATLAGLAALSLSQGDILYRDGSGLQRLAAGAAGQLLKSGGSGANPSWVSSPYDLGHSGIPLIIVSSGTMGNNGALSGITAVSLTPVSAYIYLPANAISAGSAAGFWYAVFSSATAATVYNNTFTPGNIPSIPGSPTAFSATGPGAFTAPITEITMQSISIPAGALGPSGYLKIDTLWSTSSSANNKTQRVRFGGTQFTGNVITTVVSTRLSTLIQNRTATTQIGNNAAAPASGISSLGNLTSSIDTTSAVTLLISGQLANAADTIVLERYDVQLTYGA